LEVVFTAYSLLGFGPSLGSGEGKPGRPGLNGGERRSAERGLRNKCITNWQLILV
jgi:hypothetical protein